MNELTNIKPILLDFDEFGWQDILKSTITSRPHYQKLDGELQYGQFVARIIGMFGDWEDDYYNTLYTLSQEPSIIVLSEELDKTINPDMLKEIQQVLEIQKRDNLSLKRLMAFMSGKEFIPRFTESFLNRLVFKTMVTVFEQFESNHPEGLKDRQFQRVLIDTIKFIRNHYWKWTNEHTLETMPKVIWYGPATKSQQYFLLFLMLMGIDVVMFHPENHDAFADIDPTQTKTQVKIFPRTTALDPFPKEKRNTEGTLARRAQEEIQEILNTDDSLLFKPWQLRDYIPSSLSLKTTHDELYLLIKQPAFLRPNFSVQDGHVYVPAIFAKVSGVSKNKREYWEKLHEVAEHSHTHMVQHFPMTKEVSSQAFMYHYRNALKQDGTLDPEKLTQSNWWKYKSLPPGLQKGLAHAISRVCKKVRFVSLPGEKKEDTQLYLFAQATNLSDTYLKLLQRFDYSQEVPKLVLYNTENSGVLTRSDAALILLLHEIGVDIVLYNPPAQNDLENYVEANLFDTHLLEDIVFDQAFKEPTFMDRVFRKIKF